MPRTIHPFRAVLLLAACIAVVPCLARAEPSGPEFAAAVGKTGYGRCHMDECEFFRIDQAKPLGSNARGALYEIDYQSWTAEYKRTDDDHQYDRKPLSVGKPDPMKSDVFCSKTDPVVFYWLDGKWEEARIRPGDDAAVFGFNESVYTFYYAACHDYITREPSLPRDLAKKLGYDFQGGFPDNPDGKSRVPEDMLK